ncbi:FK506-binding protein-like isoform X2 [Halichoeres trimaculatus]|uniref:FK506-binding protein-like isoform X2 n=1 Tax=Halichoeres trimaculatus TaxID=147232 RepID=UPI003D9DBEA0
MVCLLSECWGNDRALDQSYRQTFVQEMLRSSGDDTDGGDITSWVSVCPRGLWRVQQMQTGERSQQAVSNSDASLSYSPRMGSLCDVLVRLKANMDEADGLASENRSDKPEQSPTEVTDAETTAFLRRQDSVLQVPLGDWITLRLGEGQCDITEACVERMRPGEKCEILMFPMENAPDEQNTPLCATVELRSFTPGKESWEMSPGEKWEWVKSHKDRGGVRFRSGDVWGAADSYSRALKLLITLYGHIREAEKKQEQEEEQKDKHFSEKTQHLPSDREFKTTKAELHSNLSLCQLKLDQPERAKASAAKATQLDPGGAKAWYRLGQACQMVNELEEAKQAFRKLLELQPESSAALKGLKNISNKEKETNTQLGLRLSKMFS